ncbi:MAG: serine protease [Bradymonadaceae bacterium]
MRSRFPAPTPTLAAFVLVTVLAAAALSGCADSVPDSEPASDDDTADEPGGDLGKKADIYGEDDRQEYFETERETLRHVGRATATLLYAHNVSSNDDGTVQLPEKKRRDDVPMCPSERFSEQPTPGECSAFLVAPDTIVTAGHCINNQRECDVIEVAFGYRYDESTDEDVRRLPAEDVYSCDSVIVRKYDPETDRDYGVYRLDRPVEDIEPLTFRTDGKVPDDAHLAAVGHPLGLPLKIAPGGRVVDNAPKRWFRHSMDTFRGNSGSAIVDVETGVVEGIHVRGGEDFVRETHDGETCKTMHRCEEVDPESDKCPGPEATRATQFAAYVPTATTGSNGTDSCCAVCTGNSRACGDACIPATETCRTPYGCACEEPSGD